ncbi:P-loop containing nucleoside triphosphate hydrolase protein [Mycena galopus ATCC 62051]|nr:P-loop containing nucleoside triphosphate hydrolase protein [Mycena galopus ATCC 62051]
MSFQVRRCIKCMMLWASTGKTCLLTSYTNKTFSTEYHSGTYGGHGTRVMIGDVLYQLGVHDTTGAREHDRIRPLGYRQTDVFLICFSIGLPASFSSVRDRWFHDAAQHHCPGVPCVIAATQIDLRRVELKSPGDSKTITAAQGEKLAQELGVAGYVECSSKTREGVEGVFDAVMTAALEYIYSPQLQSTLTESMMKPKKKCVIL